jgi:hypothetical protein
VPKPAEEIMAWIATLTPANELAVRMALCLNNPWCQEDQGWQTHIRDLQAKLCRSPADRERYESHAAEMARDMDAAVREIQSQASAPQAPPPEPPPT